MSDVDLHSYFRRIGYMGNPRPDLETLQALQLAHATSVPFENLDIQMGLPIRLDLDSLQDKIVERRRGGYCFEQNTLFLAVLRQIGFDAEPFLAQVRVARQDGPRTHMLIHVRIDGVSYVSDVGFGNTAPLVPLRLSQQPQKQFGHVYRIGRDGSERVLQWLREGSWFDLYAFLPIPMRTADFEVANHYTSTHPSSGFVQALVAQMLAPTERHVLRDLTYQVWRGSRPESEQKLSRDDLPAFLEERYGIVLPPGARLRSIDSLTPPK